MQAITITELVAARINAKRNEDSAVQARRDIDEQIAALMRDPAKAEGAVSQKTGDYKVTCTFGITRKVDKEKLSADWAKLSDGVLAAFRWKPEVSVSELKKLDGVDATVAAAYVTASPAAPQIKIEAI